MKNFVRKRKSIKRVAPLRLNRRGGSHLSGRKNARTGIVAPVLDLEHPGRGTPAATVFRADSVPVLPSERLPYDGNTAFNLYLREVGQTPLLTIEEENHLAARIKKGDRKARERMIKANLRLVVKIAREYEEKRAENSKRKYKRQNDVRSMRRQTAHSKRDKIRREEVKANAKKKEGRKGEKKQREKI